MSVAGLETMRLRLRSFEESDVDTIYRWENDIQTWSSSMTLNPLSYKFIRDYVVYAPSSIVDEGQLYLLLEDKETKEALGYVQLLNYEALHQKLALGVYLEPKHRNKGYAIEALECIKEYVFAVLNCRMIYAETLETNSSARHLFERAGFHKTAVLKDWYWLNGAFQNLIYYQIWR